jgi:hypothetical protein
MWLAGLDDGWSFHYVCECTVCLPLGKTARKATWQEPGGFIAAADELAFPELELQTLMMA